MFGGTSCKLVDLYDHPELIHKKVEAIELPSGKPGSKLPNLPDHRMWSSAVIYKGDIYVIGGCGYIRKISYRSENTLYQFDTRNNKWISLPPMHYATRCAAVNIIGQYILVIGGIEKPSVALSAVQCYDIINKTWSLKSPLSSLIFGASSCTFNDTTIMSGGIKVDQQTNNKDSLYAINHYSLQYDKWEHKGNLKTTRHQHGMCTDRELIFIIGGYNVTETEALSSVECYNPHTHQTTSLSPLPWPRASAPAVYHGGFIYVIGGDGYVDGDANRGPTDTVLVYSIQGKNWLLSPHRLSAVLDDACAVVLSAVRRP